MSNIRNFGLIFLLNLVLPVSLLHAQPMLDLIRKIKVDDNGVAGAVDGCAFSSRGDLVAASDNTGLTKIYRVADGKFVTQVKHNEDEVARSHGETNAIHFSVDDKYFLTGMNKTGCKIWELATGKIIRNLGHGKNTDGAAFSPDGKWVAVAHRAIAAVYRLWDFEKMTEIPHPTLNECNSIDWSSDSSILVTGSDGACCKIIRISDWKVLHTIDFGIDRVKSVRISPDSKLVAVSGQKARCRVYNVSDGKMVADLLHNSAAKALPGDDDDGPEPNVEAVEWSTDSQYLFSGGLYSGVIRVWRVADWSLVGWVQGQEYSRQVEYMAVNNKDILAAGGDEGYLYLFQFNPPPEKKLIQQKAGTNGIISIEAEDFDANVPQGGHAWEVVKDASASGGKKVQALPDNASSGHGMDTDFQTSDPIKDSPKLDYRINITEPGTYYVWARAQGVDHYANSYHIGMNGLPVSTADRMENLSKEYEWIWSNQTKDPEPATLDIPNTGPVTLNLWMRENGVEVDKIVLAKLKDYAPKDLGPKPNEREGQPTKHDDKIDAESKRYIKAGHKTLVADGAVVETLATGFGFLEGPIADKEGNIYFTDIPKKNIHIWTIENELKTFRENSGGANGLAFLDDNTLAVCEGDNRRVTEITLDGKVTVIADQYEGKKLNSPNDLWIDPKGGIYFTDPRYGRRDNLEQDGEHVYYISPDRKKVTRVVDDLIRPNGLLGSPDGKLLYVADRTGDINFVYTINADGTLSNKTFFSKEGSDGMTMDSEGNIYITSPRGEPPFHVSIYSPEGVKLEEIVTGRKPGNVHFGGKDGKTLFIPARPSLFAIKMRVGGVTEEWKKDDTPSGKASAEEYTSSDGSLTVTKVFTVRMNDEPPSAWESNNEAAEFSPDGNLLAVACGDMTVRILSVPEGKIVREFPLYDVNNPPVNTGRKAYEVEVVFWTPDAKYLVAAGNQVLPAMVVEYATGKIIKTLVQAVDQDALAISNNGKYTAVAANDELVVYQTSDWTEIKRLKPTNDDDLNSFDFSWDDKYLITGGNNGHVGVLTVPDFEVVKDLVDGDGYVKAVRISPDGQYIVRSSHKGYFELWSFEGVMLKKVDQPDYVEGLAFHPSGKYLVSGGKGDWEDPGDYPLKVYTFPDLEHILDLPTTGENAEYLDISPNGRYLAQPSTSGNVIVWEIKNSGCEENLPSSSSLEIEDFISKLGVEKSDADASQGRYLDMGEFGYIVADICAAGGDYDFTFRIRTPDKDDPRHMGLFVNGEKIDVLKSVSTSWEPYVVENVTLNAGSNIIEIRDSESGGHGDELDIDKIDIELVSGKTGTTGYVTGDLLSYKIEAEDMKTEIYEIEERACYSGGKGLWIGKYKTSHKTGTAEYTFMGESGMYTMDITYVDEEISAPIEARFANYLVEIVRAGTASEIDAWIADKKLGGHTATEQTLTVRHIQRVSLEVGDVIRITGTGAGRDHISEHARLDYMVLTKTHFIPAAEKGRFTHAHKGFKEKEPIFIPGSKYRLHQIDRPQPPRVIPPDSNETMGQAPPSDATVLFDGTSMDQFEDNPMWEVKAGSLVAGKKFLVTKDSFGDCKLHVEWRTPNPPRVKQGLGILGNSGIVLMSLYEVQVYDSYTAKIYPDGSAAAVYGQTPPLVNACRGPGQWQTYDIIFKAPVFKDDKLAEPAWVTVLHNGVLVQNNTKILGPTAHRHIKSYKPHAAKLPLALKGENTPVEYRNIWIRDLSADN